jgi:hypothetical protein
VTNAYPQWISWEGRYTCDNGNKIYSGTWKADKMHGKGVMVNIQEYKLYYGNWKKGKLNGTVIEISKDQYELWEWEDERK